MCDVCRTENLDWRFLNGPSKDKLQDAKLHTVYMGRVANIKLCHIHSIELFVLGEYLFLSRHHNLCQELATGEFARAA